MKRWLAALLVILLTLAFPHAAVADGKVFLRSNAYATIPDQSALIVWRDGIETLAIETRFDGEGAPGAWIVPLPSVPLSIEPATTGLFPTLRQSVVPRVERGVGWFPAVALGWALMLIWGIRLSRGSRVQIRIIAFALILVVGFLLLPTIGRARSAAATDSGVKVIERQIVGAFDSAVIQGESGRAIIDWLNTNGFSCDPAVEPVADELTRDGWVFVASRLRDAAELSTGLRAPHPLVFRFRTAKPVYPLRLTGVNNGSLLVDLFVLSDEQAFIPGWQTIQSRPASSHYSSDNQSIRPREDQFPIVHEGLRALAVDSSWLTRLRVSLTPEEMRKDAVVQWRAPNAEGLTVRTLDAAISDSIAVGMIVAVVASLLAFAMPQSTLLRLAALATIGGLTVGGIAYTMDLPDLTVKRDFSFRQPSRSVENAVYAAMVDQLNASPSFITTEAWARERASVHIEEMRASKCEGFDELREEDSPGNYLIRANADGQVEFVRFGSFGEPFVSVLAR